MDTLPPELIGNILRHLKKKRRLTPFALISRTWHEEVERITFSSLSIKNTELATFASILSNQPNNLNRRKYLRRLRFEIQIQKFQVAKGKSLLDEIDKQKQHNKATFTKAIRNLFETLSSWDLRQSIDLELYMRDPKPDLLGFDISFCETAEFTSWEDLPTLSCVRSLICGVPLALNVFMHIVRALPKLWHLSWWIMEEDDNINSLARRKARYDVGKYLRELPSLLPLLRSFEFDCCNRQEPDYEGVIPSVLLPGCQVDHLCESLKLISQSKRLESFTLRDAVISSQLFSSLDGVEEDWWPNLTHFYLDYSQMAADGGWFFIPDPKAPPIVNPDVDDNPESASALQRAHKHKIYADQEALARTINFDDTLPGMYLDLDDRYDFVNPFEDDQYWSDLHRSWPAEKLERLFLDMARAVKRMPALRMFSARVPLPSFWYKHKFECSYYAAGERGCWVGEDGQKHDFVGDKSNRGRPRLYWRVAGHWRMGFELERCWKETLGEDLLVRYEHIPDEEY